MKKDIFIIIDYEGDIVCAADGEQIANEIVAEQETGILHAEETTFYGSEETILKNLNVIICPSCAEIVTPLELGKYGQCPHCDYENGHSRLLTINEIIADKEMIYNDVNLSAFVKRLLEIVNA